MVASANGEIYAPYSRVPAVEEGFQSSEDGSEMHSPVYDGPFNPHDWLYVSGQGVPCTPLFIANWDGQLGSVDIATQARDAHLEGFALSRLSNPHDPTHHLSQDLSLHGQSMLDFESPTGRFQPSTLAPVADYTLHLPQSRLSEPQYRITHDVLHDSPTSYTSRHTNNMPSHEETSHISLVVATKSTSSTSAARPPRREASNVVIACRQCRARKIRCDSTRPVCHNCTRRNNECEYDAVPKRRGPDKRPGTRQRSCKKRSADANSLPAKKKRKIGEDSFDMKIKESEEDVKVHGLSLIAVPDNHSHTSHSRSVTLETSTSSSSQTDGHDLVYSRDSYSTPTRRYSSDVEYADTHSMHKPILRADVDVDRRHHDEQNKATFIPLSPSVEYSRKTWWDNLLREHSLRDIIGDLHFLLSSSGHLLSFIHTPTFLRDLRDPQSRVRMQPALIMSALAMATLMKSSEIELGSEGRSRALYFRDTAQSLLENACSSQSVDYTLAEAALVLAIFEASSHPQFSFERVTCSLQFLDRIIQVLSLCSVDAHDSDASVFPSHAAPIIYMPENYRPPKKCCCVIAPQTPVDEYQVQSPMHPPWNPNWSDVEIRKEECRRLCWTALALVASYTLQCSAFHQEPLHFALSEPSNFALLFPGEAYERALGHEQMYGQSPKESVWAVYCRSLLLWSSSLCRPDASWTHEQKSRFTTDILKETQAVQRALDMHQCNVDGTLSYMCKELLYNTRLTITFDIRRLQDVDGTSMFDRRQAEEWLYYQEQVAKGIKAAVLQLGDTPGHLLSRRPFQVNWIASQVVICLSLWDRDHTLVHALELAKTFIIPLDVLNALWPSSSQRGRRNELRRRIEEACVSARMPPPLPAELTLPPILRA